MIREFTDRRPALSAVIIALLFSAVPGVFILALRLLPGGASGDAGVKIVVLYAFILELLLCFQVERPIMWLLPFGLCLGGFLLAEILYTISMGLQAPGAGPSPLAFLVSSALVIVFGSEAGAVIGGLLCFGLISIVRSFFRP